MKTDRKRRSVLFVSWRCYSSPSCPCLRRHLSKLAVVVSSFQRDGIWTLANYREILSQAVVIEAIVSSLGLSIGDGFVVCARRRPARVSVRTLHISRQTFICRDRSVATRVAATRRHGRIHLSVGETGILAHGIQNLFGLESPPWRLARLAGVAAVSHLHDVSVFLRAHRRGSAPDRRESRGSSAEFGSSRVLFSRACCCRNSRLH